MTTAPAFYYCTSCQDYFEASHFSSTRTAAADLVDAVDQLDAINEQIALLGGGDDDDDSSWQAETPSAYEMCSNCGGWKTAGFPCGCEYLAARRLRRMGANFDGFRPAAQSAGCDPAKFPYQRDPALQSKLNLRRLAPKPRDGGEALDRIWARSMPPD